MTENAEANPTTARSETNEQTPLNVGWTGLPRYLIFYIAIVVIGTSVLHYVFVNSTLTFANNLIPPSPLGDLAGGIVANVRQQLFSSGLLGLIAANIGVVIVGVVSMLGLVVLTHVLMRFIMRGDGTIPNQTAALLGVYNKWLPVQYALLVVAALFAWGALPESLCLFAPGIILALYIGAKVPAQIGAVYGVSARRGCMAYVVAIILFSVITGGFFYFLFSALFFALDYRFGA